MPDQAAKSEVQGSGSAPFHHGEYEPPTHMLTIEVPLRLVGPFPQIVVKDAITAVLSIARVSGSVTDNPQVTLSEVPKVEEGG
jgi:hypothetical protein